MNDDPAIFFIPPAWVHRNRQRIALLRPELRPLAEQHVARCHADGLPVVLMPPVRTDADQLALYKQGRELRDGLWRVVDPKLVITNAATSDSTPHGEHWRAAYDLAFLIDGKLVSPAPGVVDSWHNSHPWVRVADHGEAVGLEAGERWRTKTFPHGDKPHYQLRNWRGLPKV